MGVLYIYTGITNYVYTCMRIILCARVNLCECVPVCVHERERESACVLVDVQRPE